MTLRLTLEDIVSKSETSSAARAAEQIMLDVQNPEIRVDEIMQRIQDKVRLRREQALPAQARNTAPMPLLTPDSWLGVDKALSRARESAQIGVALPPMSRTHGLKRAIAVVFARLFLRVAQLITRDQRVFNHAVVSALQAFFERIVSVDAQSARTAEQLSCEAGRVTGLAQESAALQQRVGELEARLRALDARLPALDARLRATDEQVAGEGVKLGQLRTSVSLQERRLTLLLEEAKRHLSDPDDQRQLQSMAAELPHVADAGYLHFEDTFRGSREEIRRRVAIYVPTLKNAGAGSESSPIVDLGCGRGELLEVLGNEGLKAWGVDSNAAAVEQCRALMLDVKKGDIFEWLRRLPDGSLGALTALHVVEHLPFSLVLELLDQALRVLRPGGVAIFETPNPLNLFVGASSFYVDPTHRNPVHPQTLHHLLEARGLIGLETLMLHPYPPEMLVPEDSEVARRFNRYFYGPQDYAVIGRRP
jgi:O-antigen chain-terminating methyltransferase